MKKKVPLGKTLLDAGYIDEFQFKSALGRQRRYGGRLASQIYTLGFVPERVLLTLLCQQLGYPGVELRTSALSVANAALLPRDMAERYSVLPVAVERDKAMIVVDNPTDMKMLDELTFVVGKRLVPHVGLQVLIKDMIQRLYDAHSIGNATLVYGEAANSLHTSLDGHLEMVDGNTPLEAAQGIGTTVRMSGSALQRGSDFGETAEYATDPREAVFDGGSSEPPPPPPPPRPPSPVPREDSGVGPAPQLGTGFGPAPQPRTGVGPLPRPATGVGPAPQPRTGAGPFPPSGTSVGPGPGHGTGVGPAPQSNTVAVPARRPAVEVNSPNREDTSVGPPRFGSGVIGAADAAPPSPQAQQEYPGVAPDGPGRDGPRVPPPASFQAPAEGIPVAPGEPSMTGGPTRVADAPPQGRPAIVPSAQWPAPDSARPVVVAADSPLILVADTDIDLVTKIQAVFHQRRLRSTTAHDGVVALQALRDHAPDALVLEVMLSGAHGFEVCQKLRASRRFATTPVILLTSEHRGDGYRRDLETLFNIDVVLEKPFPLDLLARRVEELLTKSGRLAARPDPARARAEQGSNQAAQLLSEERLDEAIDLLRRALEEDPYSEILHYQLGTACRRKSLDLYAIEELEKAIALKADFFPALRALASLYQERGFRRRSFELWERALEYCADDELKAKIRQHLVGYFGS